jgi:hypothetical protein
MNRLLGMSIVVFAGLAAVARSAEQLSTPAGARFRALQNQYERAASGGPFTDAERLAFVGRSFRRRSELAGKLIELAEAYPGDPVAVDALIQAAWQVNTTPWPVELVGENEAALRALALLERDELESPELGPLCDRLSYGFHREYEVFLRAVLEKSPRAEVRAQACVALAHLLNNRAQRTDLARSQPQVAKEFAEQFGQDYLDELLRQAPAARTRAVEQLLEIAAQRYGDVMLPGGRTAGERAAAELFELRSLAVGKEAPNIVGQDQEGRPLELRDYRGRVVLLDFWSEY